MVEGLLQTFTANAVNRDHLLVSYYSRPLDFFFPVVTGPAVARLFILGPL